MILGGNASTEQREMLLGGAGTGSLVWQSIAWTVGIGLLFGIACTRTYRNLTK